MNNRPTESDKDIMQRLAALTHGFWQSSILFAGVELGVFAALRGGAKTPAALAGTLGCDARGMTILLRALAGLGLLRAEDGAFAAPAEVLEALAPGGPRDQTAILKHLARMWEPWGKLAEVVRAGRPAARPDQPAAAQEEDFRAFIEGMNQVAGPSAAAFAALPEVAGAHRMLDVGGGPGTYAIAMARRHAGLRATILDRPAALAVARTHVEAAGLADRVELRPGDAVADEYGAGYDVVLLSQLLHAFGPEDCRAIVGKAAAALAPGGLLAINEFALAKDAASPAEAAIFGVNMLVNTEAGWTYTVDELAAWQREAGLEPGGTAGLLGRSTLVLGRKARP